MTEDELVARSKKSKSDVTNEEMGTSSSAHVPRARADIRRGVQDVEAGLRRSYGELQGRGGLVESLRRLVEWCAVVSIPQSCVHYHYALCYEPRRESNIAIHLTD